MHTVWAFFLGTIGTEHMEVGCFGTRQKLTDRDELHNVGSRNGSCVLCVPSQFPHVWVKGIAMKCPVQSKKI